MSSRRHAALKTASGLATVLTALAAQPVRAADDPFALDPAIPPAAPPTSGGLAPSLRQTAAPAAREYIFFAAASVNGRELTRMVKLSEPGGKLAIARASLATIGLTAPAGAAEFVVLDTLPGVTYAMNWQTYQLTLSVQSLGNPDNVIDYAAARRRAGASSAEPLAALTLGYDLSLQAGPGGMRLGGQIATRFSKNNLAAESGWTFVTGGGDSRVVRLDSRITLDDPAHLRSVTLGDFIQSSSVDARAVRMGGIQVARNFALQPDFISYPLPDFAGELAVPQQLDLIVNDRRLSRATLQAGSFSLRNVPVAAGHGRLGVVVRDTLGREQYLQLDYYVSRQLLEPGISQWSGSLGKVRRRYGLASGDYGPLAVSGVLRRGISQRLTLGLSGEGGNGLVQFGGDATMTIGALAELTGSVKVSHLNQAGLTRDGRAVSFSLTSAGRSPSLRLSGRVVSPGYDDLASAGGDAPPSKFIALALDFDLGKAGGLSFNAVREADVRISPRLPALAARTVASLSYRTSFGRANLFADLSWRRSDGRGTTAAFVGLSLPLGGRTIVSAALSHDQRAGQQFDLALDHPAIVPGELGYGLRLSAGRTELVQGQLGYQGGWGRVEAAAELIRGQAAARLSARGALVVAGGGVFAVKDSANGMVLVDTGGAQGVKLARDNLPVATTGARRQVLMTDLIPRTAMRIGIVSDSLPSGVIADRQSALVAVPGGTVARVDLGLRPYRPVTLQLLDHRGQPFAPGTALRTLPSGSAGLIGFGSVTEINAAAGDRRIEVTLDDGSTCLAELADLSLPGSNAAPAEPATLRCFGRMRRLPIAQLGGK